MPKRQLKNDSSTPLYIQLENTLRESIDSGLLSPGEKLATEEELSVRYHVSRVTVRKALAILEENHYIERKIGKGTYVAEKKLKRSLSGNVTSFTKMCAQMGTKASARTTKICYEVPDEEIKSAMNLSGHAQALLVERVRYSDGQPVMIERDWFSEEFDYLFEEDLNNNSLYESIRLRDGIVFSHASRLIDIVFADAMQARLLGVKAGYPLLRIYSVTETSDNKHVTVSEQLCIGDKFRLSV